MSTKQVPERTERADWPVLPRVRSSVRELAGVSAEWSAVLASNWRAIGSPQTGGSDPQSWRRKPPLLRLRVAPPCLRLQSIDSARVSRREEFERR
jgi:hypothetical protein